MKLKIFSYNLHKGFDLIRKRFVLGEVKEALNQWYPDLVFLQELPDHYPSGLDNGFNSPLEQMADQLWPHTAYGKNAVYQGGMHGNAIMSRYPFKFYENLDISTNRFERRGLLHAIISVPEHIDDLHLFCCHSNIIGSIGHRQLKKIVGRIQEHVKPNQPMILAGDFNDWHSFASNLFRRELDLSEAFDGSGEAKTFPSWLPLISLDRVFYRGLRSPHPQVLNSTHWRRLSDHLPLFAEFSL